ncbi:MAG: hypothetical protein ACTTKL_06485 [Treponema sp.]
MKKIFLIIIVAVLCVSTALCFDGQRFYHEDYSIVVPNNWKIKKETSPYSATISIVPPLEKFGKDKISITVKKNKTRFCSYTSRIFCGNSIYNGKVWSSAD